MIISYLYLPPPSLLPIFYYSLSIPLLPTLSFWPIPYRFSFYRILSFLPHPIISYQTLSHPIPSYPILSYPIPPFPILLYPSLPFCIRPYPTLSEAIGAYIPGTFLTAPSPLPIHRPPPLPSPSSVSSPMKSLLHHLYNYLFYSVSIRPPALSPTYSALSYPTPTSSCSRSLSLPFISLPILFYPVLSYPIALSFPPIVFHFLPFLPYPSPLDPTLSYPNLPYPTLILS